MAVHAYQRPHGANRRRLDATGPAFFGAATVRLLSAGDPYVRLPERVELTLAEAASCWRVLDVAVVTARTDDERAAARDAAEMITAKLWPELGDLLDGDDEAQVETDDHAAD